MNRNLVSLLAFWPDMFEMFINVQALSYGITLTIRVSVKTLQGVSVLKSLYMFKTNGPEWTSHLMIGQRVMCPNGK